MLTKTLRSKGAYILALLAILGTAALVAHAGTDSDPTALRRQTPTPVPLAGHPAITAENAAQLVEIGRYGTGVMNGAVWSPDGRTILCYGLGLWFYDAQSLAATRYLDTGTLIVHAAYSPDGSRLATANRGGTIHLYDATSGDLQATIPAYGFSVDHLAFSPDGTLLASSGSDEDWYNPIVKLWDLATGRARLAFRDFRTFSVGPLFSPDGSLLAAAGDGVADMPLGQTVILWDVSSGERQMTLTGPSLYLRDIAFHPDGTRLIVGGADGIIYEWDVTHTPAETDSAPRKPSQTYADTRYMVPNGYPSSAVTGLAYSPDGAWFLSVDNDKVLRVWSAAVEVRSMAFRDNMNIPLVGNISDLMYSPDGTHLLVTDNAGRVLIWDMADPGDPALVATLHERTPALSTVSISADGDWVAAGSWFGGAWVWDTASGAVANQLPGTPASSINDIAFSPTGTQIAVSQIADVIDPTPSFTSLKYPLLLWSPDPAVPPVPLSDPDESIVNAVAFSADGTRLYVPYAQGIQVRDVASSQVVDEFPPTNAQDYYVSSLSPNPSGAIVAFTNSRRNVRLWEVATGKELPQLTGFSDPLIDLSFNPEGTLLAALDSGGTLIAWDTATWAESWYQPEAGSSAALAFSPDGALLALGGYEGVKLWDVKTHQQVSLLASEVYDLVFSADGSLLVTAGADGTVRLWAVP